jgi:hypothetical protein
LGAWLNGSSSHAISTPLQIQKEMKHGDEEDRREANFVVVVHFRFPFYLNDRVEFLANCVLREKEKAR